MSEPSLGKRLAKDKEMLIKAVISKQIGHEDWKHADIKGRGEFKIQHDNTEIFAFDGIDLIHFGQLEVSRNGKKITASQGYRFLLQ